MRPSQGDTYGGNTERGESSRPAEAREFRAGRDKRKKGGRVFSLENRVDLRLDGKRKKRAYVCVYIYFCVSVYVCVNASCMSMHEKRKESL